MSEIVVAILSFITPCVNFAVMLISLPRRWKLGYTLPAFAAVLLFVRFPVSMLVTNLGVTGVFKNVLTGFVYLPFLLILVRGQLFQKIFSYFMQMTLSAFQLLLASGLVQIFFPSGGDGSALFRLIVQLVMYAGYIALIFVCGRRFFEMLFVDGRPGVWALYAFGAALSFVVVVAAAGIEQKTIYFLTLFFAVWSFGTLCFAIINTHEKARQRYEADLARSIVSSGREHYHKMDEMYGKLRMLRHNYKYHLSTVSGLLRSGNIDEVRTYLADAETELSESELTVYCSNTVINALLVSYAERCARLCIKYDVKVTMPDTISVPNYEMCIILGNLLENAVDACQKQNDSRWVRLLIKPSGAQLVVKVKNSFNGIVAQENGQPVTLKKDGGLGLKSVQAVAAKYEGELFTEWDRDTFTAYVLVGL